MSIDPIRRAVLIDIAYEIGGAGLAGFPKMLYAVREGSWAAAAAEIKDSLLYSQVPSREQRNMMILATGQFPTGVVSGEQLTQLNEGCILTARPDAKGKWEIGYGHDIDAPTDGDVPTCLPEDANAWFAIDYALASQRAEADVGTEYW